MVKPSVSSAVDPPVASTNLKRNLRDWIQLQGVNVLPVSTRKTGPVRIQRHNGERSP